MQTYHKDKRARHHRRFWTAVLILGLPGLAGFVIYQLLHVTTTPSTVIHNAPPLSTSYGPNPVSKMHIDKPSFVLDLPNGWKEVPPSSNVNIPSYSFRSPSTAAQQLDVYIDNIPSTLAVNRVVAVNGKGATMDHESVSDNCAGFTPSTNPTTGVTTGRWQGTSFLCDEGNYERDLVGITSSDGMNQVALTGPVTGSHKVFIAYVNNNINPDFAALYGALESFKLK